MALIIEEKVLNGKLRLKLALATIVTAASTNILWVYLILYAKSLEASKIEISAITSISSLFLMTSPIWGYLSDKYGYSKVVSLGQLLILLSSIIVLLSHDVKTLLFSRSIIGLGLAMFIPSMLSLMSSTESRRSLYVGVYSASQSTGWAVGLIIGGFIAKQYSIIHSFYLSFILALIGAFTLKLTIKGVSISSRKSVISGDSDVLLSRSFLFLSIASFFRDGSILGAYSLLPVFLKGLGASEDQIGMVLAVNTVAQIFLMLFIGKLSELISEEVVLLIGIAGTCTVIFLYSIVNSVIEIIPIQLLLAISFSSFYISSRSIASKLAPKSVGAALGTLTLCRNAGGTLMPLLAGIVWNLYGTRIVFEFLSLICLIGLFNALAFVFLTKSLSLSNSSHE